MRLRSSSQGCPGMHQTLFSWAYISYLARRPWLSSIITCSKWKIWRPWQQLFAYLESWVWFFCFITSENTTFPLLQFQSAAFHGVCAVKMVEKHVNMVRSFQQQLEPLFLYLVSIFRILLSWQSLKSIKKSSYARKNCRKFAKTLSVSGIPTCSNTFAWGKLT
jgi:hypothetical protein